jgi:tRNA threonylcarbamoyladenosine biosynthesis protein TsaB
MPRYLAIETATPVCSVALIENDKVLSLKESTESNAHSKVLTVFIQEILETFEMDVQNLDAIAVSKGPGSYTGLRIGVSAAKGLCYAGDVPLISVNTLQSMAWGIILHKNVELNENTVLCPMIDARRMEVYSALYDVNGNEVRETEAEIIDAHSFSMYLEKGEVLFFGDGAEKCKEIISHPNAKFIEDFSVSAAHMVLQISKKYELQQFEDVAYFEPFYLKDFIAGAPRVKGLR